MRLDPFLNSTGRIQVGQAWRLAVFLPWFVRCPNLVSQALRQLVPVGRASPHGGLHCLVTARPVAMVGCIRIGCLPYILSFLCCLQSGLPSIYFSGTQPRSEPIRQGE